MAVEPQHNQPAGHSGTSASSRAAVRLTGFDPRAFAHAPVPVAVIDLDGRIVFWNDAAVTLLGWTADEAVGRWASFVAEQATPTARAALQRLRSGLDASDFTYSPHHRDGTVRHVLASSSLLRDDNDEPAAVLIFLIDITDAHEAALAVADNEHKWRLMLQHISDTVTVVDNDGRIRETSGEFTDVLGYSPTDWHGRSALELIHPDEWERAAAAFAALWENPGETRRDVFVTLHADGHWEHVEYTGVFVTDAAVNGIVLTTRNVSGRRRDEELRAGEAQVLELIARDMPLRTTLDTIADMVETHTAGSCVVLVLDDEPRRIRVRGAGPNVSDALAAAAALIPPSWLDDRAATIPPAELHSIADLAAFVHVPELAHQCEQLLGLGVRSAHVIPVADRRAGLLYGLIIWYRDVEHQATDHESVVARVAGHLAAIAIERARSLAELERAAHIDPLTGLANRTAVLDHLGNLLASDHGPDHHVAVLAIDLDRFKVVNDSLGHAIADDLIARCGERIAGALAPNLVGRIAADEYIAVMRGVADGEEALAAANRVEHAMREHFAVPDGELALTVSIGVAMSAGATDTRDVLVQQASAALERAKSRGRNRTEVFDRAMRDQAADQLHIERDLRFALDRLELALHYQPKIDLRTGRIAGVEALLRWRHPERGFIPPSEFIPIAEENGLIRSIGHWVIDEAVHQAANWRALQPAAADLFVSINVSARQLLWPDLVTHLDEVLRSSELPPDRLVLELTESMLVDDRDVAFDALGELKSLGLQLAIDDFGTGYSSLNYLHRFPVDLVKIDRSFVTELTADGGGSPIATAVLHVASALGLHVCAEGVELPEQLEGLRNLGCQLAQGYLFAKPLPAAELAALLASEPQW